MIFIVFNVIFITKIFLKNMNLPASNLDFLKDIAANNNRDWFEQHKPRFKQEHEQFKQFAASVVEQAGKFDVIESHKVYRIYRDIRFSKDKTPYKTAFSFSMTREGKLRRGGYYCHIQPGGNSFVGGGFWGPNKEDLKRIREEIAFDDQPLRKILNSKGFINHFGTLGGDQLKTAPKGYPKAHKAIDLLRYKQFLLMRNFPDEELLDPNFSEEVANTYQAMLPFFNYMTEVLTTNANGEVIV